MIPNKCFVCGSIIDPNEFLFKISINETKLGLICDKCKKYLESVNAVRKQND